MNKLFFTSFSVVRFSVVNWKILDFHYNANIIEAVMDSKKFILYATISEKILLIRDENDL